MRLNFISYPSESMFILRYHISEHALSTLKYLAFITYRIFILTKIYLEEIVIFPNIIIFLEQKDEGLVE